MTVTRVNIINDNSRRDQFIRGVKLLKDDILRPEWPNTYDLFVIWHYVAMNIFTPPGQFDRNSAHRGPVFLPWHRWMLILMEHHLQRVLDEDNFGLPYWDWAGDGELPSTQQKSAPIWGGDCMGGSGNPVTTGPFAQGLWKINVREDPEGNLVSTNSSLRRNFGARISNLPNRTEVRAAVNRGDPNVSYDSDPWSAESISFRNELEGWLNAPPSKLHNAIHVWVEGDMFFGTSPNDPVFYLNHCNVDRIWSAWIKKYNNPQYLPGDNASDDVRGHRLSDQMHSLVGDNLFDPLYSGNARPKDFLNVSSIYEYDTIDLQSL